MWREVFESRTGEGHFWQHEQVKLAGYEASKAQSSMSAPLKEAHAARCHLGR